MKKTVALLLLFCIQYLNAQQKITLSTQTNQDNSISIRYEKNVPGSYVIYLDFTRCENAFVNERKFIVDDYAGILIKLKPIEKTKSVSFSYTYKYHSGIPDPKVDTAFVYLLPFKDNAPVDVRYLTNLDAKYFSKEEPKNWKSFQFNCNKADTVCAARKGIVVNVVDSYSVDTTGEYSYASKRNYIEIEHKDGTFAKYEALDAKNIFVKPGDVVLPNQPLATLIQYDKSGIFQLRFTIYYLTEILQEDKTKQKFSHAYVDPYFQTTEGIVRLAPQEIYTARITEDLIIKELSKKELKKKQKK